MNQPLRDLDVFHRRFETARRVVVRYDDARGMERDRRLKDLARMDERRVERPDGDDLPLDDLPLRVEVERHEVFLLGSAKIGTEFPYVLGREDLRSILRIEPLAEREQCDDLQRLRSPEPALPDQVIERYLFDACLFDLPEDPFRKLEDIKSLDAGAEKDREELMIAELVRTVFLELLPRHVHLRQILYLRHTPPYFFQSLIMTPPFTFLTVTRCFSRQPSSRTSSIGMVTPMDFPPNFVSFRTLFESFVFPVISVFALLNSTPYLTG